MNHLSGKHGRQDPTLLSSQLIPAPLHDQQVKNAARFYDNSRSIGQGGFDEDHLSYHGLERAFNVTEAISRPAVQKIYEDMSYPQSGRQHRFIFLITFDQYNGGRHPGFDFVVSSREVVPHSDNSKDSESQASSAMALDRGHQGG